MPPHLRCTGRSSCSLQSGRALWIGPRSVGTRYTPFRQLCLGSSRPGHRSSCSSAAPHAAERNLFWRMRSATQRCTRAISRCGKSVDKSRARVQRTGSALLTTGLRATDSERMCSCWAHFAGTSIRDLAHGAHQVFGWHPRLPDGSRTLLMHPATHSLRLLEAVRVSWLAAEHTASAVVHPSSRSPCC